MIRRMLVAHDGSKGGEKAFTYALALAKRLGVGLQMVCVEEAPRFPASIDEVTEALLEGAGLFDKVVAAATAQAAAQDVAFQPHVVIGHPVAAIVEFIRRGGYDLLVVGYMGHSALYNRIIGSTTDRLVELAPCQVWVVK